MLFKTFSDNAFSADAIKAKQNSKYQEALCEYFNCYLCIYIAVLY